MIALKGEDGRSLAIDYVDGLDVEGLRVGDVVKLNESSIAVLSRSQLVTADTAAGQEPFDPAGGRLHRARHATLYTSERANLERHLRRRNHR